MSGSLEEHREANRRFLQSLPLHPTFPNCDADGTPYPGCGHQWPPDSQQNTAVIFGIANAIVEAGIPDVKFHAGDHVTTSWGCENNKRMKTRQAVITDVLVVLCRHPRSMWFMPSIWYIASSARTPGMVLTEINDGEWVRDLGDSMPVDFRLEWISPITGWVHSKYPVSASKTEGTEVQSCKS